MLINGTNTMSCVVVGNSCDIHNMSEEIDSHTHVFRTGVAKLSHDTGNKTDVLVTRTRKINMTDLSNFQLCNRVDLDEQSSKPHAMQINVLHNDNIIIQTESLLDDIDNHVGLNADEKPTLGMIAIQLALSMFDTVHIAGMTTDIQANHNKGHYGDPEYTRVNDYHSLMKELLYINKMIRLGAIVVL